MPDAPQCFPSPQCIKLLVAFDRKINLAPHHKSTMSTSRSPPATLTACTAPPSKFSSSSSSSPTTLPFFSSSNAHFPAFCASGHQPSSLLFVIASCRIISSARLSAMIGARRSSLGKRRHSSPCVAPAPRSSATEEGGATTLLKGLSSVVMSVMDDS